MIHTWTATDGAALCGKTTTQALEERDDLTLLLPCRPCNDMERYDKEIFSSTQSS